MVKAKSQFKRRSTANNVEIIIPVPSDADSPKFKTTIGHCKYAPEIPGIIWTIKSFPGGKEYLMRAHFGLPSVESELTEGKPPIQVKFEIPYFTTSGIQVQYQSKFHQQKASRPKVKKPFIFDMFITFKFRMLFFQNHIFKQTKHQNRYCIKGDVSFVPMPVIS